MSFNNTTQSSTTCTKNLNGKITTPFFEKEVWTKILKLQLEGRI